GTSGPDPTTVYVDMRALRHDRSESRRSLEIFSLPLCPFVALKAVNDRTGSTHPLEEKRKKMCSSPTLCKNCVSENWGVFVLLLQIWVHSAHNGSGYYSGYGEEVLQSDHFSSRLSFGDTQTVWARTGYLGFLRRTELTDANGGDDVCVSSLLYLLDVSRARLTVCLRVFLIREARCSVRDLFCPSSCPTLPLSESRVLCNFLGCFKSAHSLTQTCLCASTSAVFTWTNLLVVVVELEGSEQEALDLVPMVTKAVLEEHYLIVGVVVVTDVGVIPINSRGEKQRMHLRDGFLQDQLDPIYVAYNM
ncbi:hypothetical protein XENOCAPTIV_014071, partial [Xenoophorus captivus]